MIDELRKDYGISEDQKKQRQSTHQHIDMGRESTMNNQKVPNHFLQAFSAAMYDMESLEEFFRRSSKTVDTFAKEKEDECAIGIRIGMLFNEVLECKGKEARNKKIDEIKKAKVKGNTVLKDIVDILYFEEEEQPLQFSIKEKYSWNYLYSPNEAFRKRESITKYKTILIESVLSHMIVLYESFLDSVYETIIRLNPLKHLGNETIQFAELLKNTEEAIQKKIRGIVEAKLWDSLELLTLICQSENIKVDRYEKLSEEFKEIYYRRNAFIHTHGCVNKDYLSKVDKGYTKTLKIGEPLICDDKYIDNALIILIKLIFTITIELLRCQNAQYEVIKEISNYFFLRFRNKEYEVSKYVYKVLSQYDTLDYVYKVMYRINYINACKQLGDIETVKTELKKLDVSAMQERFVIAKLCLEDNTEKITKLLNKSYPNSYTAIEIRDWPIFINYRETTDYHDFVRMHVNDFAIQELEQEIRSEEEVIMQET